MLAFLHDLSNAKYEMLNQHAIHTAEYFMAYSWPKISGGKKGVAILLRCLKN